MAGRMTVDDLLRARDPVEHVELVRGWAGDAWAAWEAHHATVRRWLEASLS